MKTELAYSTYILEAHQKAQQEAEFQSTILWILFTLLVVLPLVTLVSVIIFKLATIPKCPKCGSKKCEIMFPVVANGRKDYKAPIRTCKNCDTKY